MLRKLVLLSSSLELMEHPFYESERALGEYLWLHYGDAAEDLPPGVSAIVGAPFPARAVKECLEPNRLPTPARALDLGCAVGRASFELARHCSEIIGIDKSRSFIEAARQLQRDGKLEYRRVQEGDLTVSAVAHVPAGIERLRISFLEGDAQNLPASLGAFDVVLLANLLDRLPNPKACLEQLPALIKPGGQLILTSPYTWLTEYTPRENWLGGFMRARKPVGTLDTLKQILSPNFALVTCKDLPLLIREHARKFQYCVAEATVWMRRTSR